MSGVTVEHSVEPDGSVTFHITVPTKAMRRSADCRTFWLADTELVLPVAIDCDGYKIKPKLLVTLFCRVSRRIAGAIHKKRILETLRSERPVLY